MAPLSGLQMRPAVAPAAASPRTSVRPSRCILTPLAAAKKKGFSGGEAQAAGVKVNSRGKVSSRPGPPSRKQMQQMQQQQLEQQLDQQPDTAAATPAAASTSSPAAASSRPAAAVGGSSPAPAATSSYSTPTETPQAVIDRMAKRVTGFVIAPVGAGLVSLGVFWYLKVIAKVEYPMWVAYLGSTLMFGGGLLGITYGILSTSWDPRREGSFWGWTELQANIAILMEKGKQQR